MLKSASLSFRRKIMPRKKKTYDNNSISALKGADRVRLRPGVIFGSDDLQGCIHGFFEILSNSIDEAKTGHGGVIEVIRFRDKSIQVKDHGRGVPLDWNEKEKRYNWDLIYCELYAGGKYNSTDGTYDYSLGLNGLGACATQYASEYFDVTSIRDGYRYTVHFEKGKVKGVKSNALSKEEYRGKDHGTTQRWKPDIEVFTDIDIPADEFRSIIKQQAIVNAGIRFTFYDEETGKTDEFLYPDGILGYVREISDGTALTECFEFSGDGEGRDREDKSDYQVKASVAFCFDNKVQHLQYFHNSSWLEHGGSPDKAVKSAFVSAFDKEIKAQNKYNKKESKITFGDIQDCLILITNSMSTSTSYENQTKKAINNRFIQQFMTDLIREKLQIWMIENKSEADKAIAQILINKRSRESSEAQRITVKKKLMEKTDVTNKVKKFIDCRSKDSSERELFICEGDSALGSLLTARDASYQALMPIRGKILNLEKASLQQVFQSDIILDLIRVMGCGVEIKGKKLPKDIPDFNINKLNFDKIIITSDQDVDGFHIRCLVITMVYKLCPKLIEEGKVYFAETPLYEITYKRGKKEQTLFAFSDEERDSLLRGKDQSKIKIQRSKGLGENDAEMMALFMAPSTRRLVRVEAEGAEEMAKWFDLFMGDNVSNRRTYIEENSSLYGDRLDLS